MPQADRLLFWVLFLHTYVYKIYKHNLLSPFFYLCIWFQGWTFKIIGIHKIGVKVHTVTLRGQCRELSWVRGQLELQSELLSQKPKTDKVASVNFYNAKTCCRNSRTDSPLCTHNALLVEVNQFPVGSWNPLPTQTRNLFFVAPTAWGSWCGWVLVLTYKSTKPYLWSLLETPICWELRPLTPQTSSYRH